VARLAERAVDPKPEQVTTCHVRYEFVPQRRTVWPRFSVRSEEATITDARKPSTSSPAQRVIAATPVTGVTRLSTMPARQGLGDFEESLIMLKLRAGERSDRSTG
jgi:hypothetical protein